MIPADVLAPLRVIAGVLPALKPLLGGVPSVSIVLDANILLAEVKWRIRERHDRALRSGLEELVASGTVVALAPSFAREEVVKYLPAISRTEDKLEEARVAWAGIQGWLRFYEPAPDASDDGYAVASATDPKDLPYYATWRQLGATAVYTRDKHFVAMGVPLVDHTLFISLRACARDAAVELTLTFSGVMVAFVGVAAIQALAAALSALAHAFGRLPPLAKVVIVGSAVGVYLHPTSRAYIADLFSSASDKVAHAWRSASPMLGELFDLYVESKSEAANRWQSLETLLATTPKRTAQQHARAALAAATSAMTVPELILAMRQSGYQSRSVDPSSYVRRLLRSDSQCVESAPGSWTVQRGA